MVNNDEVHPDRGRVVILAYRGTEPDNAVDWLTDASVHPDAVVIPFAGGVATCAVRAGFYRNVRTVPYTYAQSMIGNGALARTRSADPASGAPSVRYVYRHDVFAHLAPKDSGEFAHLWG